MQPRERNGPTARSGVRTPRALAVSLCLAAGVWIAASAQAVASIRTEGQFLAYDAAAKTVTVRVVKPGAGAAAEALAVGQPAVFQVEPEGSVLTRTNVTIRGVKSSLDSIPAGGTVSVYWQPDAADAKLRVARKIDVLLSDEELDLRDGTE